MGPKMECHISDGPQTPEEFDELFPAPDEDPDFDPTPWCHGCGANDSDQCDCGPIADNH